MRVRATIISAALLSTSACGAPPPPEKSAVRFRSESGITSASWGNTPAGTRLEACPLYTSKRPLTIVLAVPKRFRMQDAQGMVCAFGTSKGFESIGVSGDADPTLRKHMDKDLKPNEDAGGDDSLSDIVYSANVPALGGRRGERLEYRCYCDGQDLQEEAYRAGGVIVSTSIPHDPKPMPKSALPIVLPTVGVERGTFGLVASGGAAVRYVVPPGTSYVYSLEDGVDVGFGKPDYHRIELHVGVRGAMSDERNRLAADPTVSGLVLTDAPRAVAGKAGQRLTYDQRFKDYDNSMRVEHVVAFQAGEMRVAVINDATPDHQQSFRDQLRRISSSSG